MSCEAHGDEDMQHGPAVEPSDDSAYDAISPVECWMCHGTGDVCTLPCFNCAGKGYVLGERDTLSNDLFPELSMYGHRMS